MHFVVYSVVYPNPFIICIKQPCAALSPSPCHLYSNLIIRGIPYGWNHVVGIFADSLVPLA